MEQSSIRRQGMKNGEEGEKATGTKPVIKAILKTKKMGSFRFDQIAAQCLGQAEAKRGRGQKEEMVESVDENDKEQSGVETEDEDED